jgi:hypothetical protein
MPSPVEPFVESFHLRTVVAFPFGSPAADEIVSGDSNLFALRSQHAEALLKCTVLEIMAI